MSLKGAFWLIVVTASLFIATGFVVFIFRDFGFRPFEGILVDHPIASPLLVSLIGGAGALLFRLFHGWIMRDIERLVCPLINQMKESISAQIKETTDKRSEQIEIIIGELNGIRKEEKEANGTLRRVGEEVDWLMARADQPPPEMRGKA